MATTEHLLVSLVSAFGNAERVCSLLAEDAQWWITPSVGVLGSPTHGRQDIYAAMQVVFGDLYREVSTEVHHVIANRDIGAARFVMRAKALFAGGRDYVNEYSVWIQRRGDLIVKVWEYLDVAHVQAQFDL